MLGAWPEHPHVPKNPHRGSSCWSSSISCPSGRSSRSAARSHGGFDRAAHAKASGTSGIIRRRRRSPRPATRCSAPASRPRDSGILANEWWHRDLGAILKAVEAEDGSRQRDVAARAGARRFDRRGAHRREGRRGQPQGSRRDPAARAQRHADLVRPARPRSGRRSARRRAWLDELEHARTRCRRATTTCGRRSIRRSSRSSRACPTINPGEVGEKGFGTTFPHDPAGHARIPPTAIFAMPLGNELVLDTALAAIEGEQLGTDRTPDLLVVSLSAHDYVGHGWGHESWEMWDLELRLDAAARAVPRRARSAGRRRPVVDDRDERSRREPDARARRTAAGSRSTRSQDAANNAAAAVLGPGTGSTTRTIRTCTSRRRCSRSPRTSSSRRAKRVIYALRSFPGIERVDRVASFAGHCDTRTGDALALCLTFDPERSGELFYLPAKGWIMRGRRRAAPRPRTARCTTTIGSSR